MTRLLRILGAAALSTIVLLGITIVPAQAALYSPWCQTSYNDAVLTHRGNQVQVWSMYDDWLDVGDWCQIGKAKLTLQYDGNLVLYDETNRARWAASWTKPAVINRGYKAYKQPDGNFVVYDRNNVALWWTSTVDRVNRTNLCIQEDGNMVIYNWNSTVVLWKTNTAH